VLLFKCPVRGPKG